MDWSQVAIATTAIAASFCVPVALVAIILYYKHRRSALNHETIAKLAEKGLPVPPELLETHRPRSGLRGGLVLVGLGLALSFYAWERGMPWSVGLIPGFMGIALLIAWKLEEKPPERRDPGKP